MTRKTAFFEGWSWFKFNYLGLALGKNFKFYTSLSKGLKLKFRKFWRLISSFIDVTGEKLIGGGWLFWPLILNRVKVYILIFRYNYCSNHMIVQATIWATLDSCLMFLYESSLKLGSKSICRRFKKYRPNRELILLR